jgi:anhydro-N-acetylmuramic acid kinase
MRIIGMISGTSHDGIDVAVVHFARHGDVLHGTLEYSASFPYDEALRARLVAALPPAPVGFGEVCELDTAIGQAFAHAAAKAIEQHRERYGDLAPDAVCSHGQTVFHWVKGGAARGTLQIGQPAWIAEQTGLTVVSDLRAADIAAGGQGAPLVPVLDRLLIDPFVGAGRSAAALNLGGIANATFCRPNAQPVAWDIGPANALVDAVVTEDATISGSYDKDGRLAATGEVVPALLEVLLAEEYYALPAPKSSGKELFHLGHVHDAVARAGVRPSLVDLVATLTELTAVTVADAIRAAGVDVLVASGGGVRNPVMMRRIEALLPDTVVITSDALGVPSDGKEAIAFALIGWATLNGLPGNVPSCTGAGGPRVLGRVTPGVRGGSMPSRQRDSSGWPARLVFERAGAVVGGDEPDAEAENPREDDIRQLIAAIPGRGRKAV